MSHDQGENLALQLMFRRDRATAAAWARHALADPNLVVLDTETTDLFRRDQPHPRIVDLAVLDRHGEPLLDTLVRPDIAIPASSTEIHHITDHDVADAPEFSDLTAALAAALRGKRLVIYNAAFDMRVIDAELARVFALHPTRADADWWTRLNVRVECAMLKHARWFGDWNPDRRSYRWQKLTGGDHRAASDCLATLARMAEMTDGHTAKRAA
jgi:DNA polymerase III epsilon subunit-like protein